MEIRIIDNKKNTHPNILYKYRNWDNELHKKVLTDNILYMASPRDFEDIHDCNIPKKFPKKSELYDFFLKKSKTEYPNRSRSEHRQYARQLRHQRRRLRRRGFSASGKGRHQGQSRTHASGHDPFRPRPLPRRPAQDDRRRHASRL